MKIIGTLCLLLGSLFVGSTSFDVSSANESLNVKCAMPNFKNAYKNAEAVFVGEVIGVEKKGEIKTFEFRVKKFWKGIEDTTVKVITNESFRYQAPYKVGETFLVFAKDNDKGGLWDGRCSRTRNMDSFAPSLKEDLKSLGEGKTCISLGDGKELVEEKTKGE